MKASLSIPFPPSLIVYTDNKKAAKHATVCLRPVTKEAVVTSSRLDFQCSFLMEAPRIDFALIVTFRRHRFGDEMVDFIKQFKIPGFYMRMRDPGAYRCYLSKATHTPAPWQHAWEARGLLETHYYAFNWASALTEAIKYSTFPDTLA